MSKTHPKIYLGLDVELGGSLVGVHPMIMIGMVAITEQGDKIFSKDYYLAPHQWIPSGVSELDYKTFTVHFEPETLSGFWENNQDNKSLLIEIIQKAKTPNEKMKEFVQDLNQLEQQYTLIILSDNPSADYTFINYYLAFYEGKKPLHFDIDGNFRVIYDTRSYAMGAVRKEFDNKRLSIKNVANLLEFDIPKNTSHTHRSSDDADYMTQLFIRTKQSLLARYYYTETELHWY